VKKLAKFVKLFDLTLQLEAFTKEEINAAGILYQIVLIGKRVKY